MNLSQKVAFNTIVQFVGRLFTALSTLIITVLIGGKLGPEIYGQYVRITSYITIWFVLLDFGINPIAVKAISIVKDENEKLVAMKKNFAMLLGLRSAVTFFILSVATIILFLLPVENYTSEIRNAILVGYIQILGQSIVSSCMPIFQVTLTYFWATIANLVGSVISLILSSLVIWKGGSVFEIVAVSMIGWVVIAVATYYFAAKQTGLVFPEFDFKSWGNLLKKSLPIGLALIFNVVFVKINMQFLQVLKIDDSVLEKYGNIDAQTGFYGIALRFFDILLTVPFFFSNAIYPELIKRKEEGYEVLSKLMKKAVNIMFLIGFPITVGGVILAPQIVYWVSGSFLPGANADEYIYAIPALRILLAGAGFFFTTGITSWTSVILDKQWFLTKAYSVVMVFNLIFNAILIPHFGFLGAVASTVLSEFLSLVLHTIYSKKQIGFQFDYLYALKVFGNSLIMGICIWPLKDTFILIPTLVGAVAFGGICYATKIVDNEFLQTIIKLKKK